MKWQKNFLQVITLGKFENDDLSKHSLKDKYGWKDSTFFYCVAGVLKLWFPTDVNLKYSNKYV